MKPAVIAAILSSVLAVALSGCCTSLMCQAEKAASAELGCSSDMKVTNVTSQVQSDRSSQSRTLRVDGCGKHVQVACEPTNLEKRTKRYREDVVKPQNRLDLKWKCQPRSSVAQN